MHPNKSRRVGGKHTPRSNAKKPKPSQAAGRAGLSGTVQRLNGGINLMTPADITHLQQTVGNSVIRRALQHPGANRSSSFRPLLRASTATPAVQRAWTANDETALGPLLDRVSKKRAELLQALSDDEKVKVKSFLENAATNQDAVKRVLHFGTKRERQQTIDAAQRVTIRSKLLVFLANGGSIADATTYRSQWLGLTSSHLGDLQPAASNTGVMQMVPLLGGLRVPAGNMNLTQAQVNQIRDVFDQVMQNVVYNSGAVPMDFIKKVREERAKDATKSLADIFNAYAPDDQALQGAAGGADCVGMAANVKRQLAGLGIESYIIGSSSGNYLNQLPSHTNERVGWQESKDFAVYSHASVVVPYMDPASGEPRAIHIETGLGPDPKNFKNFVTLVNANQALGAKQYDTGQEVDPKALAKKHVKVKWRMWLSDTADQTSKVFIDLISGSVWLSKKPVEDIEGLQDLQDAGLFEGTAFNFENALKTPDKEITISVDENQIKMSSGEATQLFFQLVAKEFKLPDSFVTNMMYLAENVDEFRQDSLLDPISTIKATWAKREEALKMKDEAGASRNPLQDRAKYDATQALMTAAEKDLSDALAKVNGGDGAAATAKYAAAILKFRQIRDWNG